MSTLFLKSLFGYCKSPLFLLGLALRLGLIIAILPEPVGQWYAPFLSNSIAIFTLDPWQAWLNQGGSTIAFPYGYAMWLFLLPFSLLCKLLSIPLVYGYGLSLIAADFGLLLILRKLLKTKDWVLLATYWLSPISLIASYCLGYNDIIPIFLLMSAVYFLREHKPLLSGVFLAAAISAKLSMALGLPFFLIYLFHNGNLRQILRQFVIGLTIGAGIFFLPFLFSQAGIGMLASNPEVEKIYQLSISLVRNTAVYLVPLAYLLMLYAAWRIKRMNFELFNAILGMAFLLVVLLTPASPGWFIWILPLLVTYQAGGDRAAIYITSIFSALYALSAILFVGAQLDATLQVFGLSNTFSDAQLINIRLISLSHTALVATGIVLAIRIWRETVIRNDFFRLSRKPFVIGVAGDSGAGKDTFVSSIAGLFGSHSIATISGDDYHLWDRHQPMWQVLTHINPAANDLESYAKNLVSLTDGRAIQACHYDHDTGKMSKPFTVKSNDIIIASGLHALYLPILRQCYDLSIYLDIDEELRKYFKIQRDVNKRGYTIERVLDALLKRKADSEKFIHPQAAFADLIFSLRPIHSSSLLNASENNPPRLKLVVKSRHGFNELSLKRVLIGVCGLHVDMNTNKDVSEVAISIEGEAGAEDIQMAAQLVCPQIFEFLDLQPQWQNGVLGLMQLITLSHINQALTRRFI
ncbi:uridine kinase [Polynucleobacter tropicus]|uniref:Phosphoribulokinase n=1 Tax=Polynucleobacter tropicus TaxID=1743174 RepID=A0A6M9PZ52_9BURK|nr:uridine kinase [Polynucleobacter tropicus]QKM64035.1 uridine kinase [Polynucleobacter tropicus]